MILKLKNVTKKFGNFVAVDDVSFSLKEGERIGLIGANGAGKTTISEIIAGINQATSGTIEYGFDFKHTPQEGIGMQFQDSSYPSGLTVKDIIAFARNLHKVEISNRDLKSTLESFQMDDFYNRKARSLSGGQRQKLNILLSVLHKPKIVILDELSTGLDIAAREDIIEFTNHLLTKNKTSAILISHHMNEIKSLCEKVIVLDRGKVQKIALIKDIEKEFGSLDDYMKTLIRSKNEDARVTSAKLLKNKLHEERTHLIELKSAYKENQDEKTLKEIKKIKKSIWNHIWRIKKERWNSLRVLSKSRRETRKIERHNKKENALIVKARKKEYKLKEKERNHNAGNV